jgi:hypothetical protein
MRWRAPHVVPLGSIFVWSMEAAILSGGMVATIQAAHYTLAPRVPAGMTSATSTNIIDAAAAWSMWIASIICIVVHGVAAHAFNRIQDAETAAGLHTVASSPLCSLCFVAAFTYVALFADACALGQPTPDMCAVLFRVTPLPEVVGALGAVLAVVIFLVSVALAFVSTPQHTVAYAFVSKGNTMLACVAFGWAMPTASYLGRSGCHTANTDNAAYVTAAGLTGASAALGVGFAILEYFGDKRATGMSGGGAKVAVRIVHIVLNGLMVFTLIATAAATANRTDVGATGVGFCGLACGMGCVWAVYDIVMGILAMISPPVDVPLAGKGYLQYSDYDDDDDDDDESENSEKFRPSAPPKENGSAVHYRPPYMEVNMMDGAAYAASKKGDGDGHNRRQRMARDADWDGDDGVPLFASEEVRRSLRLRPVV